MVNNYCNIYPRVEKETKLFIETRERDKPDKLVCVTLLLAIFEKKDMDLVREAHKEIGTCGLL